MPRRTFNVDLLHLAESFGYWCAQRGQSRSVVLRELVSNAVVEYSTPEQAKYLPPPHKAGGPRPTQVLRIGVRLDDNQLAQLRCRASDVGMSVTRYLKTLLANAESGRPTIAGVDAVQALRDSNQQLSAIARKLIGALREQGNSHRLEEGSCRATVIEAINSLSRHLELSSTLLADVERTRGGRCVGPGRGGNARGGRQHAANGR